MSFQVTRCENQVVLEEAREKCEIKKTPTLLILWILAVSTEVTDNIESTSGILYIGYPSEYRHFSVDLVSP